jgi:hypothetical protein
MNTSYQYVNWNDYIDNDAILLDELNKRLSFREPFVTNMGKNPIFLTYNEKPNINTITSLQSNIIQNQAPLLYNRSDLSHNIDLYSSKIDYLKKNNDKYHFNDTQDPNVIIRHEKSNDIKSAILNDVNEIKLYQNSIYVSSIIAISTFLIASLTIY